MVRQRVGKSASRATHDRVRSRSHSPGLLVPVADGGMARRRIPQQASLGGEFGVSLTGARVSARVSSGPTGRTRLTQRAGKTLSNRAVRPWGLRGFAGHSQAARGVFRPLDPMVTFDPRLAWMARRCRDAPDHRCGRNATMGSEASSCTGSAEPVRVAPMAGNTRGASLASQGWRRQNSAAAAVASSGVRNRCSGE